MRDELKPLLGVRSEFTATYESGSSKYNRFAKKDERWLLFTFVWGQRYGRFLTDHLWFRESEVWKAANLEPGDRVKFEATVIKYRKVVARRDETADGSLGIGIDYKLAYPRNVVKVRKSLLEDDQMSLEEAAKET